MEYNFSEIEKNCKKYWAEKDTYKVNDDKARPKYYVLDMFPYPSGAALHVGHPLGYVASDIYARYKRLKGFNVLHPMGFDAFGLPAEQYAIETGTPPAITTEKAIARFREQMDKIGFNYDWSRTVTTCEPSYYKWTQWIFLKLFESWYNREKKKAEPIESLVTRLEKEGINQKSPLYREGVKEFGPGAWSSLGEATQQRILMNYRLAFLSYAEVNWCAALGTVLANDEVKDGRSERGGYPVERRKMRQWFLRITEYSDRLLEGLEHLDWSDALKDMQRNWIGRSEGAKVKFRVLTPGPSPKERGSRVDENAPFAYLTGKVETSKENITRAKENRKSPTPAEAKLWDALRNRVTRYKFRRQHLIDRFIVDFVCLPKGLVIEADGRIHDLTKEEDAMRTQILNASGFKVIRFTNEQILQNIDNVIGTIVQELNKVKEEFVPLKITQGWSEDSKDSPLLGRGVRGEDSIEIFTTRPDTIFGATFMVLAPEHELIEQLTTAEQKSEIDSYISYVKSRTDVERQQEKRVTGAFTGSYAINPFTNTEIPIYIAEYVLAGYGTGAIMAVPADDERDRKFAEKFGLPIIDIVDKSMYPGAGIEDKLGKMINSGFLNGLEVKDAIKKVIDDIESRGIGSRKVNYKQRDAGFSRQRYWGEPFPIKYKQPHQTSPKGRLNEVSPLGGDLEGALPYPLDESQLPLLLPEVSTYKPTGDGRSPLANSPEWLANNYETDTMPGYAGSSWYFLRYMDANNPNAFASKESLDYWQKVDVYFGGTEHAVGHMLYARLWHKVLYDLGYVPTDEPFQKVVNQGMIQGRSSFMYNLGMSFVWLEKPISDLPMVFYCSKDVAERLQLKEIYPTSLAENEKNWFADLLEKCVPGLKIDRTVSIDVTYSPRNVNIAFVHDDVLNVEAFKESRPDYSDSHFILNDKKQFICDWAIEKMSKSKLNTIDPTDVINKYGADCFRLYEMFLGPIELSKPWDDKGITGVQNFLRKFWRLFYDENGWKVKDEAPTEGELKILHKTIKKVAEDIERFNYNTCVSSFMIAANELSSLGSSKREILEPLLIALAPLAPFVTEELWLNGFKNQKSIHQSVFPLADEKYLVESVHNYGVSINGKVRAQIQLAIDIAEDEAKRQVMDLENVKKWTNGAEPKKFIFVKGKIINIVI